MAIQGVMEEGSRENITGQQKLNFQGHRKGLQTDKIDRYRGEKKLKAQKNVKLKICVSLSKIFG